MVETYHVTFDENMEAIRRMIHLDNIKQNSNISYYIIHYGRSLNELTQDTHVLEDRWSRDQHIKHVNIIGDPREGMLTRSKAAKLIAASANECLFADFLSEIEPKKVSEASRIGTRKINIELLPRTKQDWLLKVIVRKKELTMMKPLHPWQG
uniref:Retrovirus-related Pol polyprotein from transposon TNT 1-94 n=1 Tax=Tanacetum cinerariifolium TaxID=118510 RepID=A0A699H201_TANCI|nr:retrovirus-related Pol polyprotein from transposon TNT 1-94 [Tanacetum cinerariifolium]